MYPNFLKNFLHILQGQSFGLQSFMFCLKLFNKVIISCSSAWQHKHMSTREFRHIKSSSAAGRTRRRLGNMMTLLNLFKLSAFFSSAGKLFQRIAPIALTISKPNLLVLMFCLFTVTPDLRLQELLNVRR